MSDVSELQYMGSGPSTVLLTPRLGRREYLIVIFFNVTNSVVSKMLLKCIWAVMSRTGDRYPVQCV